MHASYNNDRLEKLALMRVFSAQPNPQNDDIDIFFDFYGLPAQITVPAAEEAYFSEKNEMLRRGLHACAQTLARKSRFFIAERYIPIASLMKHLLQKVILGILPLSPAPPVFWRPRIPLRCFLRVSRQRFLLSEDKDRLAWAVPEAWRAEIRPMPPAEVLLPRGLPALATGHLEVAPARYGRDRVSGTTTLSNLELGSPGPHTYTVVCLRDLGADAAADGCHRAMAFQIRQLERVGRRLSLAPRLGVCVPRVHAYVYHQFAAVEDRLPVGVLFDELPGLVPLRTCDAPLHVLRGYVRQICSTVEWLVELGIGWGGSFGAQTEGDTLLDAVVVDKFDRPWLMEGFTEAGEGGMSSDLAAIEILQAEFGLLGI